MKRKPTQRTAELREEEREAGGGRILLALCVPLDPAVPEVLSCAGSFERASPLTTACDTFLGDAYFLYVCLDFWRETSPLLHETVILKNDCFFLNYYFYFLVLNLYPFLLKRNVRHYARVLRFGGASL